MSTSGIVRESLAEFLGTFILCLFGCGVCAQVILNEGHAGKFISINLGWALGLYIGLMITSKISGGHLNPAVTVAMAVHRKFPLNKILPYIIA